MAKRNEKRPSEESKEPSDQPDKMSLKQEIFKVRCALAKCLNTFNENNDIEEKILFQNN